MCHPSLLPHSYFQSGSSGCFRSQRGLRLRTTGALAKLYSGGGEVVAHSKVHASHGSLPASSPFFSERTRFIAKQRTATACRSAPIEVIRFRVSQPRPAS